MAKITIDGKEYNSEDLPADVVNTIVAKQEIDQSRIRHIVELEKIDVLSKYYVDKVGNLMAEFEKSKEPKKEEVKKEEKK